MMSRVSLQDHRQIVIPLDTALDALVELDREHGGRLGEAQLVHARIETDGIEIQVRLPGSSEPTRRKYPLAAIAAAFIHYCSKMRIPLPRQGTKRISVAPEGFVFTIEQTIEFYRRHSGFTGPVASKAPQGAQKPETVETLAEENAR